jgi:hypothetical protein
MRTLRVVGSSSEADFSEAELYEMFGLDEENPFDVGQVEPGVGELAEVAATPGPPVLSIAIRSPLVELQVQCSTPASDFTALEGGLSPAGSAVGSNVDSYSVVTDYLDEESPARYATPNQGRQEPALSELTHSVPTTWTAWPEVQPSTLNPEDLARTGSLSPAGTTMGKSQRKRWAHNRAIANYFDKREKYLQVRCRTPGCKNKSAFHCRGCSTVEGNTIRCLKHVTAICTGCRGAHAAACNPSERNKVTTCIEAGLYRKNSCRLCEVSRSEPMTYA